MNAWRISAPWWIGADQLIEGIITRAIGVVVLRHLRVGVFPGQAER